LLHPVDINSFESSYRKNTTINSCRQSFRGYFQRLRSYFPK